MAGEVKDCVAEYGHVIADECHHLTAFSFERVMKQVKAKFIVGLTATPVRKEGHIDRSGPGIPATGKLASIGLPVQRSSRITTRMPCSFRSSLTSCMHPRGRARC
jgi:hypothetical protein